MKDIDPSPYLLSADLVTAEDVAEWQREHSEEFHSRFCVPMTSALLMMLTEERLDRERRQACRRGARYYIVQARAHYDDAARWPTLAPSEWASPTECDEWVARSRQCLQATLTRAIAFRAAAKKK